MVCGFTFTREASSFRERARSVRNKVMRLWTVMLPKIIEELCLRNIILLNKNASSALVGTAIEIDFPRRSPSISPGATSRRGPDSFPDHRFPGLRDPDGSPPTHFPIVRGSAIDVHG